jgi:hypothetical protein
MATIKQRIQEVISRHYAMYYSGVEIDDVAHFGRMLHSEAVTGLAELLAEGKIEEHDRAGTSRYYPLADEREKHFTMETPEEAACIEW